MCDFLGKCQGRVKMIMIAEMRRACMCVHICVHHLWMKSLIQWQRWELLRAPGALAASESLYMWLLLLG